MDNEMNFGQLVTAYENYEYSQEYYDFLKECKEIEIMGMYLENQRFIAEEASNYNFSDGYLCESVSDSQRESINAAYMEKVSNIEGKLIGTIKKAWERFVKFLAKWFKVIADADVIRKEVIAFFNGKFQSMKEIDFVEAVKKAKLYTDESISEVIAKSGNKAFGVKVNDTAPANTSKVVGSIISDICVKTWGGDTKTRDAVIVNNQKDATDVNGIKISHMCKGDLLAALTERSIILTVIGSTVPSVDDLLRITVKTLNKSVGEGKESSDSILKELKKAAKSTISISVNKKSFDDAKKFIDNASAQISNSGSTSTDPSSASKLNEINLLIAQHTAALIKIFNHIAVYRKSTLNVLNKIMRAA